MADRRERLLAAQPVSAVVWRHREQLAANDYNPNRVAPPELDLLEISILADGWTQPIVIRPAGESRFEIIDGFHRWMVSAHPEVYALTEGLVPTVILEPSPSDQRMSTVRHNRARGTHHVVRMADIVIELADAGMDPEKIRAGLGMDEEELARFLQRGRMLDRGSAAEFSQSWKPKPKEWT